MLTRKLADQADYEYQEDVATERDATLRQQNIRLKKLVDHLHHRVENLEQHIGLQVD